MAAGFQSFLNVPSASRFRNVQTAESGDEDEDGGRSDEGAPLLSQSTRLRRHDSTGQGYGSSRASPRLSRQDSRTSSTSRRNGAGDAFGTAAEGYNVNFPPSVPASPRLGASAERPDMSFVDAMLREELHEASKGGSPEPESPEGRAEGRGAPPPFERRKSRLVQEPEDVCFPQEGLSELGEEEVLHEMRDSGGYRLHRRRRTKWPDLSYLEEWARFEKEGRTDEARAKKITEPKLVNGRLRPTHKGWFRSEEEAPYRFTYFNEEFQSTIHSQTISGLVQPGGSFRDLFIPEPRILSDSEPESEDEQPAAESKALPRPFVEPRRELASSPPPQAQAPQLQERETSGTVVQTSHPRQGSGQATPRGGASAKSSTKSQRSKADQKTTRYGDRPVWWLDILSPTEAEMKVLSKTFGIHPLTAEDIMVQEAREKVELFRHYYFVNYRTFEQDPNSENFLEPVNMYVVVFREGVLSFHFSMTPHPANVRRRIRQLRDYLILSSDWISYAIIDDITDVFVPLIQAIEEEVDDIDDAILQLHSSAIPGWSKDHSAHTHYYQKRMAAVNNGSSIWGRLNSAVRGGGDERKRLLYQQQQSEQHPERADVPQLESGADMLRRVGDCRKKVMGLYRLLGNKADVIKGFAKRCNEQWDVAPRSEIGLYLGDIQDHIVTMTGNLSHYEKWVAFGGPLGNSSHPFKNDSVDDCANLIAGYWHAPIKTTLPRSTSA